MMERPLVTVLMPVYNTEVFLSEAINSILNQTYPNIEFLIFNDASTDKSASILRSFSDERIKIIDNPVNLGLTKSLNKGLELAQGKYIARMDADDISLPTRIEKQVDFMEKHPEVGLCGTYLKTLGLENDYVIKFRLTHDEIKFKLFFDTHFPHPAAMLRKSVLDDHDLSFNDEFRVAQDYELWNKMASYCQIAMVPEVLVLKRTHANQTTKTKSSEQSKVVRKVHLILMENLGLQPTNQQMDLYEHFLKGKLPESKTDIFTLLDFIDTLIIANNERNIYKIELFNRHFAEKYWNICTTSTHLGIGVYKKYNNSYCKVHYKSSFFSKTRFLVKSLLHYKYDHPKA